PGTSELCLAVAGYHPANLPQIPPAGVTYDYWMLEGLRDRDNAELHVTATGCDDGMAVSLSAGSLNALALHGFRPEPPDMSEDRRSRRKDSTTQLFWTFAAVCRDALDRLEAEQIVARPGLRCLES